MNKSELQKHIAEAYSTAPDFPWESTPEAAVYRHENNRKWFALVMTIPKTRLGIRSDGVSLVRPLAHSDRSRKNGGGLQRRQYYFERRLLCVC